MEFLKVSGIHKKKESDFILREINFTQARFQKLAIAGETGSGKTSLLKIVGGLITPDAGEVWFEGERIKKVPEEKLIPGHPGIAYLSQQFDLPHFLTVEQILIYANSLPDDEAEKDADAKHLYDLCHISHLLHRRTDQLSGGEKQRVAMARALISSPRLLLLDEPFSNLDMIHKNILKSVIHDIGEKLKVTCIMVSHDPLDTLSWADQLIIMKDGRILQEGSPKFLYSQPANEYVAGLLGNYNLINQATAKLFQLPERIESADKNLFLRPEQLKTAAFAGSTLTGTVKAIRFFGGYYEINVFYEGQSIIVRTADTNFTIGDAINIALSTDSFWYL